MRVEIGMNSKQSGYFNIGECGFVEFNYNTPMKLNNIDNLLEIKRCINKYGRVVNWNIGGWYSQD